MNKTEWILLDTEVNGIKDPIYVVELAAQRMRGWLPHGKPFRRLLNHNTDIPPEASRVNGYTREILERDGELPLDVYRAFEDYVGGFPLVAYHLQYDLNDVLKPEWERLGIQPVGSTGFCALRLAQRLLDPVPAGNHKLQTLRQYYRLPERGAHTARGDVETVVDLMQLVLRPLAEQRGLETWGDIRGFASAPWFPSRIAFGKFKGRLFREARNDSRLYDWIKWLSNSSNPNIVEMGSWYLQQLEVDPESPASGGFVVDAAISESGEVVIFEDLELGALRELIDAARSRLADLEVEYTRERLGVEVVQSQLFNLLRPHYQRRDELRLVIQYRRKYLDTLIFSGEEEAEEVKPEYENARSETEREYEEAATQSADSQPLTEEEEKELKTLSRKLVRLYHPDRFASDPEKQEDYTRLTAEINTAKDRVDIKRLREIAEDPQGFLVRQGWGSLDFEDDAHLTKLRQHYENLQAQILSTLGRLAELRESSDYELYRLSREREEFIREIADQQAEELVAEITQMENEAQQLAEGIGALSGTEDLFGEG